MTDRQIFKARRVTCHPCNRSESRLLWSYEANPLCDACGVEMSAVVDLPSQAPSVHGDECDVMIRHGICHEDGSPKRYRSKAEIKRAAAAKGLVRDGDTPKIGSRWF
jgi:NMD protein affecting ribosome stability and mRNA decay